MGEREAKKRAEVVVVGLGPGHMDNLSLGAWRALQESQPDKLVLRTAVHPTVSQLEASGLRYSSCDHFYESEDTFEQVYAKIVDHLIERAYSLGRVHYAVPGHPATGEDTVRLLLQRAGRCDGFVVSFAPSMDFTSAVCLAAGVGPEDIVICDAVGYAGELNDALLQGRGLLFMQVYNCFVASELKLVLLEILPAEHQVFVLKGVGSGPMPHKAANAAEVATIKLGELDGWEIDHLTSVYVPALRPEQRLGCGVAAGSFSALVDIMRRLRSEDGCPWDKTQTNESLKRYLLEECHEVLEALDQGDEADFCEELGDVLLQVVFHARIAEEEGRFTIQDVIRALCEKLIRRHPHVFGELKLDDAAAVSRTWESIKEQEHAAKASGSQSPGEESVLEGVGLGLPALMRAREVQKEAAKYGFDWPDLSGPWAKVQEELQELAAHLVAEDLDGDFSGQPGESPRVQGKSLDRRLIESEFGDLLFALVNVSRFLGIDPETALLGSVSRFLSRFAFMERRIADEGQRLGELSLEELDAYWEEAKEAERA